jgi:hypothetical protein
MRALEAEDVTLVLPFLRKDGEGEVVEAFHKVIRARKAGGVVRELADRYFFETAVRLHRAGERAPYTGLKPAGLNVGPVIPVAERAIETGSPEELLDLLSGAIRAEVRERFDRVMRLKRQAGGSVDEAREYVEAMLGLQVHAHTLYECAKAEVHEAEHSLHGHT